MNSRPELKNGLVVLDFTGRFGPFLGNISCQSIKFFEKYYPDQEFNSENQQFNMT